MKVHFRCGFMLVFIFCLFNSTAQGSRKALFLGNSYTGSNNLPQLVANVASSAGDTLIYDSRTPGGYQLIDHSQDPASQNKIQAGGWDYVVIQGQSQEPILASTQFNQGGGTLFNQIKQYNPCATVMPYMTWGRQNGDANNCPNFPVMCTYESMDSLLRLRYLTLTDRLDGTVSPVSVVWRHLRQNHPNINLYRPDGSHPSQAGSYAAACCFYTSIFKKDPTLISYNYTLSQSDASIIRNAVKTQVYDSLALWNYEKNAHSEFTYLIGQGVNEVILSANSRGVTQDYFWDFGDGNTSNSSSTSHSYSANGSYLISLTTVNCDSRGPDTSYSDTTITFCSHTPTVFSSNPWLCKNDTLWTQTASAYQWLNEGHIIPENNRFLANYQQYNGWNFSVISTQNGCSELSQNFVAQPAWPGYYFNVLGNPCQGQTVYFAVLHFSGSLSGSEIILWYKNDTLLPAFSNADTLVITNSGKYECKVIDPASNCPGDTTSYQVVYNCSSVGIKENKALNLNCSLYPIPASEKVTILSDSEFLSERIQIFNLNGSLVEELTVSSGKELDVSHLNQGLYIIRFESHRSKPLKLIKQ